MLALNNSSQISTNFLKFIKYYLFNKKNYTNPLSECMEEWVSQSKNIILIRIIKVFKDK